MLVIAVHISVIACAVKSGLGDHSGAHMKTNNHEPSTDKTVLPTECAGTAMFSLSSLCTVCDGLAFRGHCLVSGREAPHCAQSPSRLPVRWTDADFRLICSHFTPGGCNFTRFTYCSSMTAFATYGPGTVVLNDNVFLGFSMLQCSPAAPQSNAIYSCPLSKVVSFKTYSFSALYIRFLSPTSVSTFPLAEYYSLYFFGNLAWLATASLSRDGNQFS